MSLDTLQLDTARLVLRVPRASDLDPWAAMMVDEENARFIGGSAPRAATWRMLMTMIGAWHAHGFAMFSVYERDTGRWVGRVGPWMPEGWPDTEVGWGVTRDCWGRGYAPEARPSRLTGRSITSAGSTSSTASIRRTRRRKRSPANSAPAI